MISAEEHDRRVTELLTANNEYLERARQAERDLLAARTQMAEMVSMTANIISGSKDILAEFRKMAALYGYQQ